MLHLLWELEWEDLFSRGKREREQEDVPHSRDGKQCERKPWWLGMGMYLWEENLGQIPVPSHRYPCKALDYLWVFRMFVRGRFWKGMICVNFYFPAKGFLRGGEMKRKGDYFLLYSWESQFL